jgi:hypothetical protein
LSLIQSQKGTEKRGGKKRKTEKCKWRVRQVVGRELFKKKRGKAFAVTWCDKKEKRRVSRLL